MQQRPPSFAEVFALVWKIVFAILLIPAVIALGYVALHVIPGAAAIALVIAWITISISLKLRR